MSVEKYIKDGKVAVLYSPGFGAGWSTWGDTDMAIDKRLVEAFLSGGVDAAVAKCSQFYPDAYTGGANDLKIEWISQGTAIRINEYDGSESIGYMGDQSYIQL